MVHTGDVDSGQGGSTGAHRRLDAFNTASAQRKLPYYEVLGVLQTATQSEITRAFRKLSLKFHPDKPGGSNEKFQELGQAYKCLRDENSRRKYDDCGFDEDNLDTDEVDQFVDAFFGEGARGVDGRSPDWSTGSVENYIRIDLETVPFHMKDIVRIGLRYIVSLDLDFENVVLLQHARVDIFFVMVGLFSDVELTQEVFTSEESYSLTYYDNPLQPGIAPKWSDQNSTDGILNCRKKDVPRRELNLEEFQRRQKVARAMLTNAPEDPMAALEEKYRTMMLATQHQARRIANARRSAALNGQDVYEDDAELDCNAYAATLTAAVPPEGSTQVQELNSFSKPLTVYESQGTDQVLGLDSDGVLFVAHNGKVLRNEGPLRPPREPSPGCLCLSWIAFLRCVSSACGHRPEVRKQ